MTSATCDFCGLKYSSAANVARCDACGAHACLACREASAKDADLSDVFSGYDCPDTACPLSPKKEV